MNELIEKIQKREVVTVGAAVELSNLTRAEIIGFALENGLKIFDEETGVWYNESAIGHC